MIVNRDRSSSSSSSSSYSTYSSSSFCSEDRTDGTSPPSSVALFRLENKNTPVVVVVVVVVEDGKILDDDAIGPTAVVVVVVVVVLWRTNARHDRFPQLDVVAKTTVRKSDIRRRGLSLWTSCRVRFLWFILRRSWVVVIFVYCYKPWLRILGCRCCC
jgi:hypothetical protein